MKTLCVFLMLVGASVFASGCDLTSIQYTYNKTTRYYYVYVPANLGSNPSLWVMLHGTTPGSAMPCPFDESAMQTLANNNNIIVIWPISTYIPANGSWFWDAYFLCRTSIWTTCPDDSGFIKALIKYQETQYSISNVYVAGMSSGAFMANRVGVDSADLVSAVGAASGQIYAETANYTMPQPSQPVAVMMLNGDADTVVPICGQNGHGWGMSSFPSSDVSLNYWAKANGCTQTLQPLCTKGQFTGVLEETCGNVQWWDEPGVEHKWVPGTEGKMWTFFQQNAR